MTQSENAKKINAVILYWSATGNTEKVANTIRESLVRDGVELEIKKMADAADIDLYKYDLVFLGAPSYSSTPTGMR